jgi:hypothetical protein
MRARAAHRPQRDADRAGENFKSSGKTRKYDIVKAIPGGYR